MIILLHSSKTMRTPTAKQPLHVPALLQQAQELVGYIRTLDSSVVSKVMRISPVLAQKTCQIFVDWSGESAAQSAAMDSFVGDIYSGLRATELSQADRDYAQQHLLILSGLYGILRPLDGIRPYRLELMYKFPDAQYANLYHFWGQTVANQVPHDGPLLNLAAIEYSKLVTPFVDQDRLIAPRFLTQDPKTGQPTFVVVHTKIARGAFARWVIQNRIEKISELVNFSDIGYHYDSKLSTPQEPVFVCREFGGKGLSMRLNA